MTELTEPTEPVLMISDDDRLVHVGRSDTVAAHMAADPAVDLEYYDSAGWRLDRTATGFVRVAGQEPPTDLDRRILVDRIDLAHAHVQVLLDRRVRDGDPDDRPPLLRVPRFQGPLAEVLATIDLLSGDLPSSTTPSPGDVWHKIFWHLTGRAH